jgi:hypothetical protein
MNGTVIIVKKTVIKMMPMLSHDDGTSQTKRFSLIKFIKLVLTYLERDLNNKDIRNVR